MSPLKLSEYPVQDIVDQDTLLERPNRIEKLSEAHVLVHSGYPQGAGVPGQAATMDRRRRGGDLGSDLPRRNFATQAAYAFT